MKLHVKNEVEACQACARHQRLSPELPWMRPNETYFETGPNFRHCIDMFQLQNEKIMLVSDWWSGMCWLRTFGRHPTTKDVTDWLEQIYLLQGAPSYIRHDGGETFRSRWSEWCRSRGIKSQCSAAFTPTSNGASENQVGLAKAALLKMVESGVISSVKDNMQLTKGLSRLMLTPRIGGLSAADMYYGRKVRSPLFPSLVDISKCRITDDQWRELCEVKEKRRNSWLKQGPKGRKSSTQLSFKNDFILETDNTAELKVGDKCLVYDVKRKIWAREAIVYEVRPSGRSYWVKECATGRKLLRSRRHLRRSKGVSQECNEGRETVKRSLAQEQGISRSPARSGAPSPSHQPSPSPPSSPSRPTPSSSPPSTTPATGSRTVRFALGTKRK